MVLTQWAHNLTAGGLPLALDWRPFEVQSVRLASPLHVAVEELSETMMMVNRRRAYLGSVASSVWRSLSETVEWRFENQRVIEID